MRGNTMTQKQSIIQWFKEHTTLNRLEAFTELGIFELSARICELKKAGHTFKKEQKSKLNRYGKQFYFTEYTRVRDV